VTGSQRWQRLSAALDRLLDIEPAERSAELERLAQGDAVFAADLRELLSAATRPDGVLEQGAAKLAPEALATLADAEESDLIGRRIGHWRILSRLGRGGMGEVLLAERDDAGFVQQAALKRLKRGMDSDELLRRFAQERRILASLEHPLIARLLDGGVDDSGRPYFAMEYIDGAPITAHAAAHALGVRERVALMQRVCEAVAYAQERLVVHRDLKPSNVMVDARGEPRLLDFGIAKLLSAHEQDTQTMAGLRVMSPAYAAPEQLLGEPISTATDVYALGVLLFELLTGGLPHPRRGTVSDALLEAASQEVTEPPSRALRHAGQPQAERAYGTRSGERERFARQIDGDLDRIVLAALRREPERRYASAAAMASDLRLYLDGRPIAARGDSAGYRLRKFVQRNKAGAIAALLALVSLLGGLGVALWQAELARRHAAEADLQREHAQRQAQRAEQVKDFAVALFRTGNPEFTRGGAEMSATDLLREAAARIDRELADTPESQAELRVAVAEALAALGARDEALALTEASIAQLRGFASPPRIALAEALHQSAIAYETRGRLDESRRAADEAFALLDGAGPEAALPRIAVRTTLAKLATFRGDLAVAEAEYRAILEDRRVLVGDDDPRLAVDWNNLGAVALRRDRYADAEHAYAEAARLLALDPRAPESRLAWLRNGRGTALMGLGDYTEAQAEMTAAQEIAERTLHGAHPIVASIVSVQGRLARYDGRTDEAIALATRARGIYAEIGHPDGAISALELGLALSDAGRADAARAALDEAVKSFEASASRLPEYRLAQAALAALDGDIDAIDAALTALQADGHQRSNACAEALGLRAAAAMRSGDEAAAIDWRRREIDALTGLFGATHPRVLAATAACTPTAADCPPARP
jgi:tetratricopeptide (TPR) repeat protein